jgi:hypothetical protein
MHARIGEKERGAHARGGGDAGKGGVTRRMEASTGMGCGAEDGGEHGAMVTVRRGGWMRVQMRNAGVVDEDARGEPLTSEKSSTKASFLLVASSRGRRCRNSSRGRRCCSACPSAALALLPPRAGLYCRHGARPHLPPPQARAWRGLRPHQHGGRPARRRLECWRFLCRY